MPSSKRAKVVSLTKTLKKARPVKVAHIDQIRECVDRFTFIYVIRVSNMRNSLIKKVRADWPTSKFFFGKNKIMAVALGRTEHDEYKTSLHQLSACIKGDCALMFTDSALDEVTSYFLDNQVNEYARTGFRSTVEFCLSQGPLDLPFSMEPTLRQLGLETKLNKGVIELLADKKVCSEGDILTPEQCRLLKLFGQQLATFKIDVLHMWTDGKFTSIGSSDMDMQ